MTPECLFMWIAVVAFALLVIVLFSMSLLFVVSAILDEIKRRKDEITLRREYELSGEDFYSINTWRGLSSEWRINRIKHLKGEEYDTI